MGGEQSKTMSGGGTRQGLSRSEVERILFDPAKNAQLYFASTKRKSAMDPSLRKKLTQMTYDLFSRQLEFSKGNLQLTEGLRNDLDQVYAVAFHPQTSEDKIFVRSQVDRTVGMLQRRIEQQTQTTVLERHDNPVQLEQMHRKQASGVRNARARASATRRLRKLKGGVLSWFQQRSNDPVSVPFRNYTRSLRSANRSSHQ